MTYANLPAHFKCEHYSTYILNKVETKAKPLTSYKIWTKHKLDLNKFKVWDCKV